MGVQSPNSTNYIHPHESNILDLHNAMDYNSLGQPCLRTILPSVALGAFGRQRVAEPYTIFDSTLRYGDDTRVWDTELTGAGSITHLPNESTIAMDVTTALGAKVVRETKRVFQYQPGKSHLSINTFVFSEGKPGLRQRLGYFGERNGIYLERLGTETYLVQRSYVTGEVLETRVLQSSWNIDTLDGTGRSTVNIDWTKVQIFWVDIEWLGAGTARCGFVVDGEFVHAHSFHHANLISTVYMTTATLPIRYEIENIASTQSSSRMRHICNTVISEGGHSPRLTTRSVSTPLTGINLSNVAETPLIALRLKNTNLDGVAVPKIANFYGLQNNAFKYLIYNDVTITNGTWVSASEESHVEYNITSTSFTGGRKWMEGIFVGGTIGGETQLEFDIFNGAAQLKRKLNGTSEIFVLAAQSTTNNDDAIASVVWTEYN